MTTVRHTSDSVGIRELKSGLSAWLRRVQAGATIAITDRGRVIATIQPAAPPPTTAWAHRMVAAGLARWNGAKPAFPAAGARLRGRGRSAAAMVIEDRQ
jgi:antitoxin (DNA-binding transcriptional repressor) of toxin-antitoxin stability system